ncbi:hypothetical protein DY000_02011951 [Brassica cretica]|uniref:Uncharacterized protein n=1 Tax=Brassica cretica TaxID=69181 RepID=A0ABQ7CP18_BRACR|nr:hypothetical protein DY000_02011951 [Brassica cretica]
MWCYGSDDVVLWGSQQTVGHDLPKVIGLVEIPNHVRFWGIDSGIRHRFLLPLQPVPACEDKAQSLYPFKRSYPLR